MSHEDYMRAAYEIARSNIDPVGNKGVGAIIVENNEILGVGCRWTFLNVLGRAHKTVHAELMAIQDAGEVNCNNANIYVTMEPCAKRWHNSVCWHFLPCCQYIINAGIKNVYIGQPDTSFGRDGKKQLELAGINVYDIDIDVDWSLLTRDAKVFPGLENEYNEFLSNQ